MYGWNGPGYLSKKDILVMTRGASVGLTLTLGLINK